MKYSVNQILLIFVSGVYMYSTVFARNCFLSDLIRISKTFIQKFCAGLSNKTLRVLIFFSFREVSVSICSREKCKHLDDVYDI